MNLDWMTNSEEAAFYTLTAIIAVITTVLLVWHMNGRWSSMASRGQRWRYYALGGLVASTAYEAIELMEKHVEVSFRHYLQLLVLLIALGAALISIKDDHGSTEREIP